MQLQQTQERSDCLLQAASAHHSPAGTANCWLTELLYYGKPKIPRIGDFNTYWLLYADFTHAVYVNFQHVKYHYFGNGLWKWFDPNAQKPVGKHSTHPFKQGRLANELAKVHTYFTCKICVKYEFNTLFFMCWSHVFLASLAFNLISIISSECVSYRCLQSLSLVLHVVWSLIQWEEQRRPVLHHILQLLTHKCTNQTPPDQYKTHH